MGSGKILRLVKMRFLCVRNEKNFEWRVVEMMWKSWLVLQDFWWGLVGVDRPQETRSELKRVGK